MKRTPTILRIASVSMFDDVYMTVADTGNPVTKLRFAGTPAQPMPAVMQQPALVESSPA